MSTISLAAVKDRNDGLKINWEELSKTMIFKVFFMNPERDFMITPQNLMANGDIVESHLMDPMFDCPLFRTPFKRNLFRLYTTIAFVSLNTQIGIPRQHLSKLSAIENGHKYIVNNLNEDVHQSTKSALIDIHNLLFKESPFKMQSYNPHVNAARVVDAII